MAQSPDDHQFRPGNRTSRISIPIDHLHAQPRDEQHRRRRRLPKCVADELDAVEDHTAGVIAQDSLIHGDRATLRNVGEPGWSLLWPGPLIWPGDHAMPSAEVACAEALKNDFLAIQRNQQLCRPDVMDFSVLAQGLSRDRGVIERLHVRGNDRAVRRGATYRNCLRRIHDDQNVITPHRAAGMGDDDIRLRPVDRLGNGLAPDGISGPIHGRLVRSFENKTGGVPHLCQDGACAVPAWRSGDPDPLPIDHVVHRDHVAKAHRLDLGCVARLAEDRDHPGEQFPGRRIEVIRMQMRDQRHLNSRDNLLGRTRQIHQWVGRCACVGRPGMLGREVRIDDEAPVRIFES